MDAYSEQEIFHECLLLNSNENLPSSHKILRHVPSSRKNFSQQPKSTLCISVSVDSTGSDTGITTLISLQWQYDKNSIMNCDQTLLDLSLYGAL